MFLHEVIETKVSLNEALDKSFPDGLDLYDDFASMLRLG